MINNEYESSNNNSLDSYENLNPNDSAVKYKRIRNEFENEPQRETKKTKLEEPGIALDDEGLRIFQVLDECDGSASDDENEENNDDDNEIDDDDSDNENSSEEEIDENEIENLLDEALPDNLKNKKKRQYEQRFKTVLEEKGHNPFEVLPEGWIEITHNAGIPIYLHKQTRVCSVSKPYFLGPGSVRKHAIPVSAITCLNYRKALDREDEEKKKITGTKENVKPSTTENSLPCNNNEIVCPFVGSAKDFTPNNESIINEDDKPKKESEGKTAHVSHATIETVKENLESQSLTSQQVREYCHKLFHFKTIRVMKFKTWSARRKFTKNRKNIKCLQRPTLPDGTKLITFPVMAPELDPNSQGVNGSSGNTRQRKEWIMNPNGKSFVCILHEYVQHALKKQPTYEFKELENAATPYCAIISINNLKYGVGYGTSKKQAKSEAARETLEILIPEMKDKITGLNKLVENGSKTNLKDLSVFDDIKITDPRVSEFCNKTTEPLPHTILLTCLQRNYGLGDVQINYEINPAKHKRNEFTMTVGKHTATVICKNKKEGKQLASQHILQILHPHIKTWGSLLRLYGNNSLKTFKEKKQEEQEITVLQNKAAINQPNYAILDKLKLEMVKLFDSRAAIESIGTICIQPTEVPITSGSNLKNVEL